MKDRPLHGVPRASTEVSHRPAPSTLNLQLDVTFASRRSALVRRWRRCGTYVCEGCHQRVQCSVPQTGRRDLLRRCSRPYRSASRALKGHYEIEREIGQGAFATVYLARDLKHEAQSRNQSAERGPDIGDRRASIHSGYSIARAPSAS